MKENKMIFGIRAVLEAIETGSDIDKILIQRGLKSQLITDLYKKTKNADIPYQVVPVEKFNRLTRKNHQGVIAFLSSIVYYKIEQIIPTLFDTGQVPMILILDRIMDVRNFGAIARTAIIHLIIVSQQQL